MKLPHPYYENDGGGAGAGAGSGEAGTQGGAAAGAQGAAAGAAGAGAAGPGLLAFAQQGNTQAEAAAQNGPKGYWPEAAKDLEATYRGLDDKGTIEKLLADISGREKAPASAKEYKLELPPEIAQKLPDMANDKALDVFREVAHANGLTNSQFSSTIAQFYAQLAEKGLLPDTIDRNAEIDKLLPKAGARAEREAAAVNRIQAVHNQVNGLVANKTLSAKEGANIIGLAATADGVMALEKLFGRMGEHGLQSGGQGAGAATKESIAAEMRDPRYDTSSSKYDKVFRARVDADWRRLYG